MSMMMMTIAFIMINSSLVPLFEGLSSSNPCEFDFKIEIHGHSPRCIFLRKELFLHFSVSNPNSTIALRVEMLQTRNTEKIR